MYLVKDLWYIIIICTCCHSAILTCCYISKSFTLVCVIFKQHVLAWTEVCENLCSTGWRINDPSTCSSPSQWWIEDKASSSVCMHTDRVSNSVILSNDYVSLLCGLWACTHGKNGIANETTVLQWVVSSALWGFKVVKKQAGALLSLKHCYFMQKPSNYALYQIMHFWTSPSEKE